MILILNTRMEKLREKAMEIVTETKRVAKEDPRRVVHSFKVGLALALVSFFYYYQPLYDNFGVNAMWAVMTVVVVFEFSVGATLGKGLNRGVATLLAGSLGVGAHHLASMSGPTAEPILLAVFVFSLAAISTFIRFFPKVKARYDYGLLIFILTFALISVSGFREDEILVLAHKRLSTVFIGGAACVVVSIFISPVWAGQDLHNLIANNLAKLGNFLEEFGDEYFQVEESGDTKDGDKRSGNLEGYKSVLNSKSNEDSLANFARWEPCHGRFRFRHPWRQYLAVGALVRQCGYRIDALNSYLKADIQVSSDIKKRLEEPLRRMSSESGKALKEISLALKKMTKSSSSDFHIHNSNSAIKALTNSLKTGVLKDIEPLEITLVATVASLLMDIVNLTEKISESVNELASAARFKSKIKPTVSPEKQSKDNIVLDIPNECPGHVFTIVREENNNGSIDKSKDVNRLHKNSMMETELECPHVAITIVESVHKKEEELGDIVTHCNNGHSDAVNNGGNNRSFSD